jgi:serine/threonine-protein kinase RsbW
MSICIAAKFLSVAENNADASGCWRQESIREPRDAAPLISAICDAMASAGFLPQDLFAVRIAVAEAISNAIVHGNRRDPRKQVTVLYRVSPTEVVARVEDEGQGFDPTQIADPRAPENLEKASGRGILLMQHYTNRLCYNRSGNCVTLCRRRTNG